MKRLTVFCCLLFIFLMAGNASAFVIGVGNTALSPYAGPYVDVNVNWTSATTATITFASLTNGGNIYLMADGSSVAVNVNATTWTIGSFSVSNGGTGFDPGPLSSDGPGNVSDFGVFNQTVKDFDGFKNAADTISFVLTNTSGTWANAGDVLIANSVGNLAAAHIFVTSSPADAKNGAIVTGFAADRTTGVAPVPIPAAAWLLGSGLIGLVVIRRRMKK